MLLQRYELMIRKGVYPYDYADGPAKLGGTKLPPKEAFFSMLAGEHISDEDYAYAQRVWEAFECKTLRDYHNLYLESDVAMLEDIFEDFRDICMRLYGLDPAHYFTSPGLSYDAPLKITGVRLELLHDPDMLMMFERGARGGVAIIFHRHGKAVFGYGDEANQSHRIIGFRQSPWLKHYIDLNTALRAKARTDSEKDFFQANE